MPISSIKYNHLFFSNFTDECNHHHKSVLGPFYPQMLFTLNLQANTYSVIGNLSHTSLIQLCFAFWDSDKGKGL